MVVDSILEVHQDARGRELARWSARIRATLKPTRRFDVALRLS